MIGDRLDGVRIEWRDWIGGAHGSSQIRTCVGTAEHVGTGWVLLRRPRGGLRLKRLSAAVVAAGRLSAVRPGEHGNLLAAWAADDTCTREAVAARRAAARQCAARQHREQANWDEEMGSDRVDADPALTDW